jgi:hypothetical protein
MPSYLFDDATCLAAFTLIDILFIILLVIRCSRATPPPAARQPLPQPPRVLTHEAQLVDVNNVRGRTHFSSDVDEICCSLCRWASAEPAGSFVVLEVDHGPKLQAFVLHSEGLDGRVVVCFAGPKLEADDTIVRGIEFCRSRGERVLAVTSDCGLRGRCAEAAKGEGEAASPPATARDARQARRQARRRNGLRPLRGHTWVAFESSATLATLLPDNSAARRGEVEGIDTLLLGPTPRSEAAAAAARWRRRERSAKKMELTADRAEQAAVLYGRLREAVAAGRASMPTEEDAQGSEGGGGGGGATPAQKARASAVAHAAWINAGCHSEKEERYAADRAAARRLTG